MYIAKKSENKTNIYANIIFAIFGYFFIDFARAFSDNTKVRKIGQEGNICIEKAIILVFLELLHSNQPKFY